jgi:hypothetical protein
MAVAVNSTSHTNMKRGTILRYVGFIVSGCHVAVSLLRFGPRRHRFTPTRARLQLAAFGRANRVISVSVTGKEPCPGKSRIFGSWGSHCPSPREFDKGYLGRAVWSCIQATSTLYGAGQVWPEPFPPLNTPDATGGMVLGSFQRRISEWPSAKEKPQARL